MGRLSLCRFVPSLFLLLNGVRYRNNCWNHDWLKHNSKMRGDDEEGRKDFCPPNNSKDKEWRENTACLKEGISNYDLFHVMFFVSTCSNLLLLNFSAQPYPQERRREKRGKRSTKMWLWSFFLKKKKSWSSSCFLKHPCSRKNIFFGKRDVIICGSRRKSTSRRIHPAFFPVHLMVVLFFSLSPKKPLFLLGCSHETCFRKRRTKEEKRSKKNMSFWRGPRYKSPIQPQLLILMMSVKQFVRCLAFFRVNPWFAAEFLPK